MTYDARTVTGRRMEGGAGTPGAGATVEGEGVDAAGTRLGGRTGLLVGVATFVVLLGGIYGAFVFLVHKPATERSTAAVVEASAKGPLVYHTLIERYVFATTLPPLGDRTVTFEYGVAVQVHRGDRKVLEEIIARGELMPKLQADIRRIISQEEYTKLRSQDLGKVSREIRETLNADLGQELVTDVVFPVWNVW